ncbi:hypothetical protein B0H13DRAFT_2651873 [Mycena leptocephala]|nr:hypothetical protein B0H13DRAFT_2651873 [Mycena leptocephala]
MSVCIQNMQRQRGAAVSKTHPTEHHLHLRALPFTLGHKHTPISAPPAAFVSASLALPVYIHLTTHSAGTQRGCLVSTQRLHGERDPQSFMRLGIMAPHACALHRENEAIVHAELCALHHLLAVPLLLEHTDPHSTAQTSIPLSAPPACTPPAPLGLGHSPPPLAR